MESFTRNFDMKGGESKAEATSTDQRLGFFSDLRSRFVFASSKSDFFVFRFIRLKTRGRKPGKKTKKDPNQPKRPPSERKKKIYGFEF
ncbi:predicted protein [Arabidopsis lyrata subsp. lyrata]|uniref:Predicted protein n=1 Tax=Arabidopsis lyrata subsp. lyrata TaxID=81972 RepID=D7LP02_ARALL|nr:predicted protein [Arabidopsis lyrata subsp. lyrata]